MKRYQHDPTPAGHIVSTVAAIGGMAVVLAVGLGAIGLLDRMDTAIGQALRAVAPPASTRPLHPALPWLGIVVVSFVLPLAMLSVPANWRRLLLWITTLVIVAGWAPVLALAARAPEISGAFTATFWGGLCSLIYTSRHRMPCDPRPIRRARPSPIISA